MSYRDDAVIELVAANDMALDPPARERRAQIAQVAATLYVGDQLARLADMLAGGFKINHAGDTFGDNNAWIEPQDPR